MTWTIPTRHHSAHHFLGLYGVDSPLPTAYLDYITQRHDGHDAVMAFLDIFNHRFITQYYRIWRKYNYPASFEAGAVDDISRCLLGLIGLGIPAARTISPRRYPVFWPCSA